MHLSCSTKQHIMFHSHEHIYHTTTARRSYLTLKANLCAVALFLFLLPLQVFAQIDAETVTNMGRNALSVDDYLTAIHYFNQAIESKPYLSAPYYYRAYAKFTLEDYQGAEADCDKSIDLNPFITEVYQLRGLCRVHIEDYDGAIADYSRSIKDKPDDQASRYNRALCYLQQKKYAEADSDLDYIMQKWPTNYRTYMVKAQCLLEQKDTTKAMEWIDKLLAKNPREGSAWSFKGRYELSKQHYAPADSCLTQAIRYQPNDFELYIARAQARHALGKFGLAIDDYDQTIKLQPNHFVAHYNRGLLRSFVGDLNRAIDDFDFVIKTEPNNTLALYNRAQLRQQVGNYKGAISDYTRLIKAYPNFMYGYLQRASLRRKVGDIRGAQNDETVVARRNLDLSFGKARALPRTKVRLRSEHELDQYQQLVQENADTARNVFGNFYGKVQNEKVTAELLPMYAPAFANVQSHGYHSVGFMAEMNRYKHTNTTYRAYTLTAAIESGSAQNAENDQRQYERTEKNCSTLERALVKSSIALAKYDFATALNEANLAVKTDSASVIALMLRSHVLTRKAQATTTDTHMRDAYLAMAIDGLNKSAQLAPTNAYVAYNQGCALAVKGATEAAIGAFSHAIALDAQLPEAYYNRAVLYMQQGYKDKANVDLSRAGQLGLYKAYALIKQNKN